MVVQVSPLSRVTLIL